MGSIGFQTWTVGGEVSTEPVERTTGTGKIVTGFRINDGRVNHDVTVWGKMEALPKIGDFVIATGRAFYDSYEKDGVKKYVTKLSANASSVTIESAEPIAPQDALGF